MIYLIFFLLNVICDAAPGHYECGVHGRFEYCLDGFPGCVIGCHCYPGYYFDTESKICEPNTKLTHDYRRHMIPIGYSGHSGALVPPYPAVPSQPPVVTASTDDPAQDSDNSDLSDWLYNQFFKTIESQVVNKTDDEPLTTGTRRSGASIEPFLTRRHSHKRRKFKKKRSSRKKIMRDDDEDSEDESSSSSDSSESDSDESSGDLGSWERYEWGPRPDGPSKGPADAHRQIVMYSKKPKPPLPSFIFLPNMGTAFFPPLGLPAPAIPMYPMVPIPPIHPGPPDYDQTTAATTTTAPTTTTASTPSAPETNTTTTTTTTAAADTPAKKVLRTHKLLNTFRPPPIKNQIKPQARQVFKPSPPPPPPPLPPMDYPMNHIEDNYYDDIFMGDNNFLLEHGDKMNASPDFKYISELIHRNTNENNKSALKPPNMLNPQKHEQFQGMKPLIPKRRHPITPGRLDATRRRFDSKINEKDDSYYSTLGKQIAKLIRGLDSADVLRADIKIEATEDPKTAHPFFSESSYAARTYWERFVRSPLSLRLKNFTNYEDLIASNENLFELENQVQEVTSAPVLSWLELENVINTMGTIRNKIHGRTLKNNYDNVSNGSLNVSLLPRFSPKSFVSHKPKIKTDDHMFFVEFNDIMNKLTRSQEHQKLSKKGFKDKTVELNKQSGTNTTLVNKIHGHIHPNTNIHVLRFKDKTEVLNKQSGTNITLVNKVPEPIHPNTNIHVLRFKDKTEELNKQSKNGTNVTLVNKVPGPIHLNTNIHVLRSVVSTQKPMFLTSRKKGTRDAEVQVKKDRDNDKIGYFIKINNKPHVFQASTYVRSNKYFFDRGINTDNQFENWAIY
ncbi:uncharacterized protein LOC134672460 [Cydia fagiglandana]|uniref:uncharacterized protein LOC134672460 n=1 Tax=Cydia fagiglandana TaxID=1458189 RepID=UPI002FEE16E9